MTQFAAALACLIIAQSNEAPSDLGTQDTPNRESDDRIGLDVGVTLSSIFNDRGTNLFSRRGQSQHNLVLVPTLDYVFGDSGIYLGYIGAYKLAGTDDSVGANGLQLFRTGVKKRVFNDQVELEGTLRFVMLPLATGSELLSVLEPGGGLTWFGPVDVSATIIYSHAIPEEYGQGRHVYFQGGPGKKVELSDTVAFHSKALVGYKVFTDAPNTNRAADVFLQSGFDLVYDSVTVNPAVNLAWVDIQNEGFGQEYMVWASLGTNLAL